MKEFWLMKYFELIWNIINSIIVSSIICLFVYLLDSFCNFSWNWSTLTTPTFLSKAWIEAVVLHDHLNDHEPNVLRIFKAIPNKRQQTGPNFKVSDGIMITLNENYVYEQNLDQFKVTTLEQGWRLHHGVQPRKMIYLKQSKSVNF